MSPPQATPQPTSKDYEKVQSELRDQASYHHQIVSGIEDCAKALNGFTDTLLESEWGQEWGEKVADPLNDLLEGLSKILQGFADIHGTQAANLERQADHMAPLIEHLRTQEAGIVIPELRRRRTN